MLKLPLWTVLVILAALLACGAQTPTPGGAVATVPATTEAATSAPSPVTPAPMQTETPLPISTVPSGARCHDRSVASQHPGPGGN